MKLVVVLGFSLVVAGCARQATAPDPLTPDSKPEKTATTLHDFLQKASDSEIQKRAISQAQDDIRAGTPHVAWCGTIGIYRPNIPPDKERFGAGLPPLDLPSGCNNPLAMKGATFAMAYNGELVKHLQ